MKIYRIIVLLLLFFCVITPAQYRTVYRGYETNNCTDEYVIAESIADLVKYDNANDDWTLRSYIRVIPPGECKTYDGSGNVPNDPIFLHPKPYSLPSDTPAVVYLPIQIAIRWDVFEAEKTKIFQLLLDSWLPETEKRLPLKQWEGTYSGAKWETEVTVVWNIDLASETDHENLAHIDFEKDPWEISVFPQRISRIATENDIPPVHLVIYSQMEELIHAKQAKKLAEIYGVSIDEFEGFHVSDHPAMEVEAKTTIEQEVWPILRGMLPPLLLEPLENNPAFDGYWEKREEFYNLLEKDRNGEEITEDDAKRFKELEDYFSNLPPVGSRINPNYEG